MLGKCAGYAHCYRITELLGLEKTLKTTNFNPLPWAELPPTRSGCPGPTQPGLEHLLGLFQFVPSYEPQTNQTSRTPKPITASQIPNPLPHFYKEVFFLQHILVSPNERCVSQQGCTSCYCRMPSPGGTREGTEGWGDRLSLLWVLYKKRDLSRRKIFRWKDLCSLFETPTAAPSRITA